MCLLVLLDKFCKYLSLLHILFYKSVPVPFKQKWLTCMVEQMLPSTWGSNKKVCIWTRIGIHHITDQYVLFSVSEGLNQNNDFAVMSSNFPCFHAFIYFLDEFTVNLFMFSPILNVHFTILAISWHSSVGNMRPAITKPG